MFIWDFTANPVMDALIDWSYGQMIGFLGNFFAEMGNMGVELFDLPWVQAIVLFFSQLAWALFGVGLVVAGFECGIEYASGRGDIQQTALSAIKRCISVSPQSFCQRGQCRGDRAGDICKSPESN